MRLAKNHIDIGLFTRDIDAHRTFWGETVGLRRWHHEAHLVRNLIPGHNRAGHRNVHARFDTHGRRIGHGSHLLRPAPAQHMGRGTQAQEGGVGFRAGQHGTHHTHAAGAWQTRQQGQ